MGDAVLGISVWEVFVGNPCLGSELLSVVSHAGLEFPEDYVQYRDATNHLQALDLGPNEVSVARLRGADVPVGVALAREFDHLGWL